MASSNRKPILEPWPGPWAKWASRYCQQNLWRVSHVLGEREDAMGECAFLYCKCRARYGAVVDNPAWFMRLYQLTVTSHFNDLSGRNTRGQLVIERAWKSNFVEAPEGELAVKIQSASSELKQVLEVLFHAPREMFDGLIGSNAAPKQIFQAIARSRGLGNADMLIDELRTVLS
jgi:hypothetical protein